MKYEDFLLPKIVFEARYKQGYRYFDRCGETLIEIENKLKGWVAKDITLSSGQMENTEEKMFFNFNPFKLDLCQNDVKDRDHQKFIKDSKIFFNIVSKNLGLKEYLRFGLRYWFLYPLNSVNQGRDILSKSHVFSNNKEFEEMFGKKIKDRSIVIVLEDEKSGHRIALSIVHKENINIEEEESEILTTPPHKLPSEQRKEALMAQAKKKRLQKESPSIAILLDIDNYINNPQSEYLDNFMDEAIKLSAENVIKLIGGKV